jgi:hypothetical protein
MNDPDLKKIIKELEHHSAKPGRLATHTGILAGLIMFIAGVVFAVVAALFHF